MTKNTIVLVGIMGVGKSTTGRRLAEKLQIPFVDTDQLIEALEGDGILQIYETKGGEYFREVERRVIADLMDRKSPQVVSLGGDAFVDDQNRQIIKEKAISIWLHADLDTVVERVSRRDVRPNLLNCDKKDRLRQLLQEREAIYGQADIKVYTGRSLERKRIIDTIMLEINRLLIGSSGV